MTTFNTLDQDIHEFRYLSVLRESSYKDKSGYLFANMFYSVIYALQIQGVSSYKVHFRDLMDFYRIQAESLPAFLNLDEYTELSQASVEQVKHGIRIIKDRILREVIENRNYTQTIGNQRLVRNYGISAASLNMDVFLDHPLRVHISQKELSDWLESDMHNKGYILYFNQSEIQTRMVRDIFRTLFQTINNLERVRHLSESIQVMLSACKQFYFVMDEQASTQEKIKVDPQEPGGKRLIPKDFG